MVSDAFSTMAGSVKDPNEYIGGARIGQILSEGITEYFAREVTNAQQAKFGPPIDSYVAETTEATTLVSLLGEDNVRKAFFEGDAKQIQRISELVESARGDAFPDAISGADPKAVRSGGPRKQP